MVSDKTPVLSSTVLDSEWQNVACPEFEYNEWEYFYEGSKFIVSTGGNNYSIFYVPRFDGEFHIRRGNEVKIPIGEFSCDVGIPAPASPYNPEQELERLRNRPQSPQLDIDLIGDYEIKTSPILPLQIGTFRREINLGGLINLKFLS
ncbi:hypothetical protein NG798_20215 [Ancylothrix sp. C2]|uniref:hypothetical protein n=1 Tax=Ancylothrix sp. D3o TaxID=2953691 RepID=UPI0021BB2D53|nr:hypothetical protein [Ancylothrix sp. D3o]MCT7952127.1 hypothetical protein [Ancylothrix sp. D3o]